MTASSNQEEKLRSIKHLHDLIISPRGEGKDYKTLT
jgi:hypothetical protein